MKIIKVFLWFILVIFSLQVITNNKQCTPEPVTVCTDAVTILYDLHTVLIAAKEVDRGVTVTVDKEKVDIFPYSNPWLSLEQPDSSQVCAPSHVLVLTSPVGLYLTNNLLKYILNMFLIYVNNITFEVMTHGWAQRKNNSSPKTLLI